MASSKSISTTRRSLMAGALAIAAVPATSIAAQMATTTAAVPGVAYPDAGLIALCEKYLAAWAESNRLCDEASRISDAYRDKFPRPDAMRVRPGDAELGLPSPYFTKVPQPPADAGGWYDHIDTSTLRKGIVIDCDDTPFTTSEGYKLTNLVLSERSLSPAAQARANEIVAAYDAWQKRQKRAPKGLRAAERQYNKANREAHRLMKQIADMPANTLEGIQAKARCADVWHEIMDDHQEDQFTRSLLGDLLSLSKSRFLT